MEQIPRGPIMNALDKYVARQTFMPPIFSETVSNNLGLVVTLPAYAEPDLIRSLESLLACELPQCAVEVVVLINHPIYAETDQKEFNAQVSRKAKEWALQNSTLHLKFLISEPIELPKKHAGAGLARKVAMDEAVVRLQKSEIENPVISCFDADATCESNYLTSIVNHFEQNPKSLGCSINFEHPVSEPGNDFLNEGIIQYELHLRYYQGGLAFANHPHAEFTVGSSMAVTRNAYVAQGGMNRRKAGEDFWFMLKLMMAGSLTAITETTIFPSSRESFRVPFGTGRAMSEMTQKQDNTFYSAPFSSFKRLKEFWEQTQRLYSEEIEIKDALTLKFLEHQNWKEVIAEIKEYTTDKDSFEKRFSRWFNVFMVMKYFHFLRDEGIEDEPVLMGANLLMPYLDGEPQTSSIKALDFFRAKKRVQSRDYTL